MATETTPLRGAQYVSDAQKRKRIVGITGAVVVLAAIIIVLWLTLSGHNSKSTEVTTPEPTPAIRSEAPAIQPAETPADASPEAPAEPPIEPKEAVPAELEQTSAEAAAPVDQQLAALAADPQPSLDQQAAEPVADAAPQE